MNKSHVMMVICLATFLGGLLFIISKTGQNHQASTPAAKEQTAREKPDKPASDTLGDLGQTLSNTLAQAGAQAGDSNHPVRAIFELATNMGHRINHAAQDATKLTEAEEMDLGHKLDWEILKAMPEVIDPTNNARMEKLAKDLVSQCSRKQIVYHFRIVRSRMVNAFSIAGGYVYVTSAFMKRFQSDGELAMTLGHEIAHVELEHAVHKVQYEYQAQRALGDRAGSIVELGYRVLSSPFAKNDEYAADAWGFTACKKAGWKPDQLFELFEDLEKYEQEVQAKDPEPPTEFERRMGQYFASHPPTADRLARLKAMP
jgi:predicted Zn-dependent protease